MKTDICRTLVLSDKTNSKPETALSNVNWLILALIALLKLFREYTSFVFPNSDSKLYKIASPFMSENILSIILSFCVSLSEACIKFALKFSSVLLTVTSRIITYETAVWNDTKITMKQAAEMIKNTCSFNVLSISFNKYFIGFLFNLDLVTTFFQRFFYGPIFYTRWGFGWYIF